MPRILILEDSPIREMIYRRFSFSYQGFLHKFGGAVTGTENTFRRHRRLYLVRIPVLQRERNEWLCSCWYLLDIRILARKNSFR